MIWLFLFRYLYLQPVASTLNIVPDAFYKVFSASPDQVRIEMRQACFDYLSLGGVYSTEPISLLAGLIKSSTIQSCLSFFSLCLSMVSDDYYCLSHHSNGCGSVPDWSRLASFLLCFNNSEIFKIFCLLSCWQFPMTQTECIWNHFPPNQGRRG